jgi:hypothetical protein
VVPALGPGAQDRPVCGEDVAHRRAPENHNAGRGEQALEDPENILRVSVAGEDPSVVTDMGD